jgi:hypothetical protein
MARSRMRSSSVLAYVWRQIVPPRDSGHQLPKTMRPSLSPRRWASFGSVVLRKRTASSKNCRLRFLALMPRRVILLAELITSICTKSLRFYSSGRWLNGPSGPPQKADPTRAKSKRDSSTAQADHLAGARWEEKASACYARNDSFWWLCVISELKLRPSKTLFSQIEGGLGEVGGAAEVAPVVVVGGEGEDGLALGGEAEVGIDDGEDAVFGEEGEEAGGD